MTETQAQVIRYALRHPGWQTYHNRFRKAIMQLEKFKIVQTRQPTNSMYIECKFNTRGGWFSGDPTQDTNENLLNQGE